MPMPRGKDRDETEEIPPEKADKPGLPDEKSSEFRDRLKNFFKKKYYAQLVQAATEERPFVMDYAILDRFGPDLGDLLIALPETFFELSAKALEEMDLPGKVRIRVTNLPEIVMIRDLRSVHIGRFISTEGIIRKASEIRPEITSIVWQCPACGERIEVERRGTFIGRPFECACGNRKGFKEFEKKLIDTRWIVIEEPFELTEGERPSQVTVLLAGDLVNIDGRTMTEPGNRIRVTGILRDIPKNRMFSVKLDFYLETNHFEPTEIGWERIELSKADEERIKEIAKDPKVYEMFVSSLAPSLYGLMEIKESIIMQLFGGVQRTQKDRTKTRGDIHVLIIGDPSSGKSQLLKLVPQIVPRGKYVSGKGATGAGLTASVSKDEQFMGGWVLEAGAMVLANKGLISIDEFEKMSQEDQVAMHEAMEQGSVSIAKASIVATLPAQTSVLAGGNPKFSRFDPYMPITKQINIPDTLLSRFDLKFILRDLPDTKQDTKIVDHILSSREDDYADAIPKLDAHFIRKYITYAKRNCIPVLTKETGEMMKKFYVETRRKAQREGGAIPITLRQFEAMIRIAEASAKIQLSPTVRKRDADRAIRLMKYSMEQLGLVSETGEIDVDKFDGALTTSKERSAISIMLSVIDELSRKKKEMLQNEVIEAAKKEGVSNPEEIIERLKREGMLFEPSPGYVQKV